MPIDVEIQNESGDALARYEGPPLGLKFTKMAPPCGACMRFIVPWGDTTFYQEQITVLREELREAANRTQEQDRLLELGAVLAFLEGATGVHVYVKFIGD